MNTSQAITGNVPHSCLSESSMSNMIRLTGSAHARVTADDDSASYTTTGSVQGSVSPSNGSGGAGAGGAGGGAGAAPRPRRRNSLTALLGLGGGGASGGGSTTPPPSATSPVSASGRSTGGTSPAHHGKRMQRRNSFTSLLFSSSKSRPTHELSCYMQAPQVRRVGA